MWELVAEFRRLNEGQFINLIDEGKILFVANYYGTEGARELAHKVKDGDVEAIKQMASEMATLVGDNAILVPIPNKSGVADWTKILANEIAIQKGDAKVADILSGKQRKSLYDLKRQGRPLSGEMLGLKLKGNLPGGNVYLIDNVYATGTTATAAQDLIPNAQILVHSIDTNVGRF